MVGFQGVSAVLTSISAALTFVTFILHVISYSTWDWLVSDGYSPFTSIGFFEVSFSWLAFWYSLFDRYLKICLLFSMWYTCSLASKINIWNFHVQFSVQNYLKVYLARPRIWMNFRDRRVKILNWSFTHEIRVRIQLIGNLIKKCLLFAGRYELWVIRSPKTSSLIDRLRD